MRDELLRDSAMQRSRFQQTFLSSFCEPQRHFRCNVCQTGESSSGLVRLHACDLRTRGRRIKHVVY
jgi:hypothetical protein